MIRRRHLVSACATLLIPACPPLAASSATPSPMAPAVARAEVVRRLRSLEPGPGRLGVCLLDTVSGEVVGTRLDEHFALCSTFKLPLAAALLREADHGRLDLDEVLPYTAHDLLPWAPVTGAHVAQGGLSIRVLAQAAQEQSDGAAANLLVRRLGGPAAVTALWRAMGDEVTRLDRYEPELGLVLSGDLRDTTSPRAMAQMVRRITTGTVLSVGARQRLLGWMQATRTGTRRLRAGLPADWATGNKTGTGRTEGTTNKCNDVAITFAPGRNPVIVAAYFDSGEYTPKIEARHEAVLAEVGRLATAWVLG